MSRPQLLRSSEILYLDICTLALHKAPPSLYDTSFSFLPTFLPSFLPFSVSFSLSLSLFFFLLGLQVQPMEVPRWGVKSEPELARPTPLPYQCRILDPLSEARDRTCIIMDTGQIHFHWAMTPLWHILTVPLLGADPLSPIGIQEWSVRDLQSRSLFSRKWSGRIRCRAWSGDVGRPVHTTGPAPR